MSCSFEKKPPLLLNTHKSDLRLNFLQGPNEPVELSNVQGCASLGRMIPGKFDSVMKVSHMRCTEMKQRIQAGCGIQNGLL